MNKKAQKIFNGSLIPQLVVALISCTIFTVITNIIINSYVQIQSEKELNSISSAVSEVIEPDMQAIRNFADFSEKTQDKDTLDLLLKILLKHMNDVDDFYYMTVDTVDEGGFIITQDDDWDTSTYNQREEDWFQKAIQNPNDFIFDAAEIDRISGNAVVTVCKAVVDKQNIPLGVVGVDITLSALNDLISKTSISANGKIYIIDDCGTFLTHPDEHFVMVGNYFDNTNLHAEITEYLDGKTKTSLTKQSYYAVEKIGRTPWFVVAEGPTSDYSAAFKRLMLIVLAVLLVLSAINGSLNIKLFHSLTKNEKLLGEKMVEETQGLVVATKESSATSQDQNAAVKEIVATVADSKSLSENITNKIKDVSKVASKTSADVSEGVTLIAENVEELHAIHDANQKTIDEMKEFGKRIESIWDIVSLINSVADQAKIIAFNAELEASSAGEAGQNFHVVANEIRRLSDGIIDGTKEIKDKITEIQQSSDTLILASESGTERINAGYETAKNLEAKFNTIKYSSEITSDSASEITEIIQQQAVATEQIFIALKQISSGIDNFSMATSNISQSAENLKAIAEELKNESSEK